MTDPVPQRGDRVEMVSGLDENVPPGSLGVVIDVEALDPQLRNRRIRRYVGNDLNVPGSLHIVWDSGEMTTALIGLDVLRIVGRGDLADLDPRLRVCAVCARVLDYVHGSGWIHPRQADDDHVPVPVMPSEVTVRGRCDFCDAANPEFIVPANDFRYDSLDQPLPYDPTSSLSAAAQQADAHGSAGNWAACLDCAPLIETNQWNAVLRRAKATYLRKQGGPMPEEVQASLRRMYRLLRAHVTGPIRPLTWPGRRQQ